jgi:hypothetical protein
VPGVFDERGTGGGIAGDKSLAREDAVVIDGVEAEPLQLGDTCVQLLAFERARGGDERNPISGT